MSINSEFFKFIFVSFLVSCLITSFAISSVVFIGDIVEYAKKLSDYSDNSFFSANTARYFKSSQNANGNPSFCFFIWWDVVDN